MLKWAASIVRKFKIATFIYLNGCSIIKGISYSKSSDDQLNLFKEKRSDRNESYSFCDLFSRNVSR